MTPRTMPEMLAILAVDAAQLADDLERTAAELQAAHAALVEERALVAAVADDLESTIADLQAERQLLSRLAPEPPTGTASPPPAPEGVAGPATGGGSPGPAPSLLLCLSCQDCECWDERRASSMEAATVCGDYQRRGEPRMPELDAMSRTGPCLREPPPPTICASCRWSTEDYAPDREEDEP